MTRHALAMRAALAFANVETGRSTRHPDSVDGGAAARTWSFSTLQGVVGLVTGLISIVGAAYSAVGTLKPTPGPGEIVAVVRDAEAAPVATAVVEVLGPESSLVTTMVPGDDGLVRRSVVAGSYRVRVVHPDFVETERDVQVQPDVATELHLVLARKPRNTTTTAKKQRPARQRDAADDAAVAVSRGIGEGRRWLGRLGF